MNLHFVKLQEMALAEIEGTLAKLSEPLRNLAGKLPVIFQKKPDLILQADGIEEDTLGLFVGAEMADGDAIMPPQIILFLENLWNLADGDEQSYCREIRTTFLHELGHYLGLDEEDLFERGLE